MQRVIEAMTQPRGAELGESADRILAVLRGATDFMSRRDIAKGLGKKQLNPFDIAVLQLLETQGVIEVSRRDNRSPVGWEWVYRIRV